MKIVTVGDSNTEGTGITSAQNYGYLLRASLAAAHPSGSFTFTNYGASWSSTFNWKPTANPWGPGAPSHNGEVLYSSVMALNPDIVPIMLGTNGLGSSVTTGYESDLRAIIEGMLAHTTVSADNLLGHTLPVLIQPPVAAPSTYADAATGAANPAGVYPYGRPQEGLMARKTVVSALAAEYGIPLVTLWDSQHATWSDQTNTTTSPFLNDGVHMNATGHSGLRTLALNAIEPYINDAGQLVAPSLSYDLAASVAGLSMSVDAAALVAAIGLPQVTATADGVLCFDLAASVSTASTSVEVAATPLTAHLTLGPARVGYVANPRPSRFAARIIRPTVRGRIDR